MSNKPKWYLCCAIVSGILSVVFLALGIFSVTSLPTILHTQAEEKSMLKNETYSQWGQVPGEFNVDVSRTYTFFNFENAFDVFFFNDTPKFTQTKQYVYQEYQNLLKPVFYSDATDDSATMVNFQYQQYMLPTDSTGDDKITTLNLGPLGFWYTAHKLPDYQFATYTLGQLVTSLELDIPTTLQASAIKFSCLSDQQTTYDNLRNAGILDQNLLDYMWNDKINGLSIADTLTTWVHAIGQGPQSGAAKILADYFYLNGTQVNLLFKPTSAIPSCVSGLNFSIQSAYGCDTNPCDPHFLVVKQLANQGITLHPAGGAVQPVDSVTSFNATAVGYPEISYYLKDYFIPTYKVSPDDYDITFSEDLVARLMNYSASPGSKYNTNSDTLLNFGNVKYIYDKGALFDQQGDITNLTLLDPIRIRFNLDSLYHAHVLYKYVVYLESEFAEQRSLGSGKGQLSIGEFASVALYDAFTLASDFVLQDLTAKIILKIMNTNNVNCQQMVQTSTSNLMSPDAANTVCTNSDIAPFSIDSIKFFMRACANLQGDEYNKMINDLGFTRVELFDFCGLPGTLTFFSMLRSSQEELKNTYSCGAGYADAERCSNHEIAVLQWSSSTVTQTVPPTLAGDLKPDNSLSSWYPDKFPEPFEYYAVLQRLSRNFVGYTIKPLDYATSNALLTFDLLFSQTQVQAALRLFAQKDYDQFATQFLNVDPYPLVAYLRYVMIQLAMGGLAQTRSVTSLLFGYDDPFLDDIKNAEPYLSGDPSINSVINLAGQNVSADDAANYTIAMFTGTNDSSLTRKIISYYNETTIAFMDAYFDGANIIPINTNPWNESIGFTSTDGAINHPNLETNDDIDLYISDINYQTTLKYNQTETMHGLNVYRYKLSPEALQNCAHNSDNCKYFADKWDGVINISAIHKAPLFVCKGHFLDADPALLSAISVQDSQGKPVLPTSDDDLYIDIEPYSGVSVGVAASLQVNYEFSADDLFANPAYAHFPIVITSRTMSFSDKQIDDVFGQLKTGISLKKSGPYIGFILFVVFLAICVVLIVLRRKLLKTEDGLQVDYGSYHKADKPNPSFERLSDQEGAHRYN